MEPGSEILKERQMHLQNIYTKYLYFNLTTLTDSNFTAEMQNFEEPTIQNNTTKSNTPFSKR